MNTTIPLALLLATTGCAASEGAYEVAEERAACTVENAEKAGMSEAALCVALLQGFAEAGGDPATNLAVTIASPTQLDVLVTEASGTQHDPITFDVMDTEMREAIVKGFGADLARILARDAASGG
ncbi:hypothetical protein Q9K02_03420 [Qipengyuania sp. G39]|uniref:Lipoprotein n=1 Tax=Qipengyuania profundimaris TaxID=3067652 RepID=A0ABT9HMW2_9SPHN|nr:hypothetical protein [Qipengyuania sp. G39]MDP4574187.1 hypothetical protein [Qipengyuania sp. G39]